MTGTKAKAIYGRENEMMSALDEIRFAIDHGEFLFGIVGMRFTGCNSFGMELAHLASKEHCRILEVIDGVDGIQTWPIPLEVNVKRITLVMNCELIPLDEQNLIAENGDPDNLVIYTSTAPLPCGRYMTLRDLDPERARRVLSNALRCSVGSEYVEDGLLPVNVTAIRLLIHELNTNFYLSKEDAVKGWTGIARRWNGDVWHRELRDIVQKFGVAENDLWFVLSVMSQVDCVDNGAMEHILPGWEWTSRVLDYLGMIRRSPEKSTTTRFHQIFMENSLKGRAVNITSQLEKALRGLNKLTSESDGQGASEFIETTVPVLSAYARCHDADWKYIDGSIIAMHKAGILLDAVTRHHPDFEYILNRFKKPNDGTNQPIYINLLSSYSLLCCSMDRYCLESDRCSCDIRSLLDLSKKIRDDKKLSAESVLVDKTLLDILSREFSLKMMKASSDSVTVLNDEWNMTITVPKNISNISALNTCLTGPEVDWLFDAVASTSDGCIEMSDRFDWLFECIIADTEYRNDNHQQDRTMALVELSRLCRAGNLTRLTNIDKHRLWEALLKVLDGVEDNAALSRHMERQLSTIVNIELAWLLVTDDDFFSADNILNNIDPEDELSLRAKAYYHECEGDLKRNLRKFTEASDSYRKAFHIYDDLGMVRDSAITKSKYILSNRSMEIYDDDGLEDVKRFHSDSDMAFTKKVVGSLVKSVL